MAEYYLNKVTCFHVAVLLKQDSAMGVFLKPFQNFRTTNYIQPLLLNLPTVFIVSTPSCLSHSMYGQGE